MGDTRVFDVRFHLGGRSFPVNPFGLQGQGTLAIEADFVTVRGRAHRTFRLPNWEQHRVRMVDVVNVRTEGPDLRFDVLGVVKHNQTIGCTLADGEMARRVTALLPARQTEVFAVAHAEREAFHDRIDYWSPSTPVIWTLLVLNIGIYLLMWLELQGLVRGPFRAPARLELGPAGQGARRAVAAGRRATGQRAALVAAAAIAGWPRQTARIPSCCRNS